MAATITEKSPYDAFVLPDGFVMYRHEYAAVHNWGSDKNAEWDAPEALEKAGVVVYPKDSPEWHHVVDDGK